MEDRDDDDDDDDDDEAATRLLCTAGGGGGLPSPEIREYLNIRLLLQLVINLHHVYNFTCTHTIRSINPLLTHIGIVAY